MATVPAKKAGRPKGTPSKKKAAISKALAAKTGAISALTPQERLCFMEYTKHGDIAKAYKKSYPSSKASPIDYENFLNRPQIKLALEEHYELMSKTYLLAQADVIKGLHEEALRETNTGRDRIAAWTKLGEILGVQPVDIGKAGGGGSGKLVVNITNYSSEEPSRNKTITVEAEEVDDDKG